MFLKLSHSDKNGKLISISFDYGQGGSIAARTLDLSPRALSSMSNDAQCLSGFTNLLDFRAANPDLTLVCDSAIITPLESSKFITLTYENGFTAVPTGLSVSRSDIDQHHVVVYHLGQ